MIHIFVCNACTETSCHHVIESNVDKTAPRLPTECPYLAGICDFKEMGVQ